MKKTLSILLMLALAATQLLVPTLASAEGLPGITWTAPGGYVYDYVKDDDSLYAYSFSDGSWIQVYEFYPPSGMNNPNDWDEMTWLDWIEDYYGGYQYMHANMRAIPEVINGYDYVKITYGPEVNGIRYYDTLYIGGPGCKYAFIAEQTSSSKPYDGALRAVVESAKYDAETSTPADDTIKIYVNGTRIISDADPVIVNGRTLVPIRAVAEAMGCTVSWNDYTRSVRIERGDLTVDLIIGDTIVLKMRGGSFEEIYADVPATIINSRTFVPVRVVAEAFGAKVDWDGNTRSVLISQ